MLLDSKNAVVFAATGAIASKVARTFAKEGAKVWLSGRDLDKLETLKKQIETEGGEAQTECVDAVDEAAVTRYLERVAKDAGTIDIVFNGVGLRPSEMGYPALSANLEVDTFLKPLRIILGSQFLTSRAAGSHMMHQGKGAIVTLSATLSGMAAPHMAALSATCGAVEAMTRSLAGEFGAKGVRVNCVRGSAMPETRTIQETTERQLHLSGQVPRPNPPLGRPITVAETAATAAFLASDHASGMTGQVVTVCAGQFV